MVGAVATPLLEVRNLRVRFDTRAGELPAVDGVSFTLSDREVLAVVGESGCGKSVTALSVMRLVPVPPGRITEGAIRLQGRDLLSLPEAAMRRVRGNEIGMVFQEPMTSLHPTLTIGAQIEETLRQHRRMSKTEAAARAIEMLRLVRIPEPEQRSREYPHQLSGGMRQRVMIAIALACQPKLLIADEPTTALDVTIQAQILALVRELQAQMGMAVLLITHDMGVVAESAHRVIVMYAGRIVEVAPVETLFQAPCHPYTRGLLASTPRLDGAEGRLMEIPGMVPSLRELGQGCAFAPRCRHATDRCRAEAPPLEDKARTHQVACWHADQLLAATP
jgi:peptide/nickel transport system ATP-binding protein